MRGFSSITSLTAHVGVAAAMLLGTAKAVRSTPTPEGFVPIELPRPHEGPIVRMPGGPGPDVVIDVPNIPLPKFTPATGSTLSPAFPIAPTPGTPTVGGDAGNGWVMLGSENGPEVLTAPLPRYPELLRQAGVQGRVVLEAVVDSTGRVDASSILVVLATNTEFVAAARQALLATLFRPAFTTGRAVRVRVHVPYEFILTNGMGRAH